MLGRPVSVLLDRGHTVETESEAGYAPSPLRRVPTRLLVSSLMLVTAVVAWRASEFYSGGADPVVLAKGMLTLLALATALPITARSHPLPVVPLAWFGAYLAIAVIGAFSGGLMVAGVILVGRLVITATVVLLLVRRYGALMTLSALSTAMAAVAGLAVVTGAGTLTSGRLSGGIPAATPNEIAILCAVPLVVLLWRWVRGLLTGAEAALIPVLATITWLTGSRTGLAVIVVAAVLMYLASRRVSIGAFAGGVLSVPIVLYVVLTTSVIGDVFARGGAGSVLTLSSRTIAWDAALHLADDFWSFWFGAGLALKQIPVNALFWSIQGLDSSWFGALVQVGWLGVAIVVGWVMRSLLQAGRSPYRALLLPLLLLLVGRSILESGLFDSTPAFLAFLVTSIAAFSTDPRTMRSPDEAVGPGARR